MLELNKRELKEYSVRSAINSILKGGNNALTGLEKEVHDELAKTHPERSAGCLIPNEIFQLNRPRRRDLNANTFGQGGGFVETTVGSDYIPVLRNKLATQRLGVRVLTDLEGNFAIPRQTAPATAYSLPEQATLTKSTQTIDQVLLTPHRVGAFCNYSRQLVLQSSVSIEDFLRDDLNAVIATKLDYLILQGAGGNSEPTGILNTTGIGSFTFGGTATWQEVVSMETGLAKLNADQGKMGLLTTPNVKGKWKAIAKTGIGVSTTVPIFLWDESVPYSDGSNDGRVNGYRSAASNNVLNDLVFFCNWDDIILGMFGGFELIADPYTQATDGTIRVTVNTFVDVAVRRAASCIVSSDSGAQ